MLLLLLLLSLAPILTQLDRAFNVCSGACSVVIFLHRVKLGRIYSTSRPRRQSVGNCAVAVAVAAAAAGREIFPALRRGGRSFKGVHIFSDLVSASSVVPGFLVAKLGSILLCEVLLLFFNFAALSPFSDDACIGGAHYLSLRYQV